MAKEIKEILDTNVLLRFLVGDEPQQQEKAKIWFSEGKIGKRKIVVKPLVVAETCFVLESFYKKNRRDIAKTLQIFLSQKWLKVEERKTLLNLLDWYKKGGHFVDSYLLACAKKEKGKILSFDKKLTRDLR